eukprot:2178687-Pyramimonas_sp.AAC.1
MPVLDLAARSSHVRAMQMRMNPQIAHVAVDNRAHRRLVNVRVNPELYQQPPLQATGSDERDTS